MTQRRDREVQQRELKEGYDYKGWTERARMRVMKMEREGVGLRLHRRQGEPVWTLTMMKEFFDSVFPSSLALSRSFPPITERLHRALFSQHRSRRNE